MHWLETGHLLIHTEVEEKLGYFLLLHFGLGHRRQSRDFVD
ncbi:hypothetical protein HanXRQr2_Chr02g0056841 [Helianthus annuus]|uniref:Uncharacterized protein n=1 Tax=Helianthus annuus TaxID=4232 RepID=A0A9K3NYB2_HELAN|nr:hypothetical protein HanXRQr2_Chr02g0056841 [Helianthus annuus]